MTYEEMIEDETFIEGMQTRIISDQEMDTMYIPDVEYMNIDGISRCLVYTSGHKHIPCVVKKGNTYIMAGGSSCGGGTRERKSSYLSYNLRISFFYNTRNMRCV